MRLLVAGSGAMGTALAGLLSAAHATTLWCRRDEQAVLLRAGGENPHLPGYRLPAAVTVTSGPLDPEGWDAAILAIPTQHLRRLAGELGLARLRCPLVSAAKGLEVGSFLTPCRILADTGLAPGRLFALSGPSHAEEMCRGMPTTLVLAGSDAEAMKALAGAFSTGALRVYYSTDLAGVELGGALKNVIAIAAGISDGLGFGMNTKSTILTRGLAEIRRYGLAKGARAETFGGLSCLGDLVTTCCSPYSRNRAFGEAQVRDPGSFDLATKLAEGAWTVRSLVQETDGTGFEMPLSRAVHQVVHERMPPLEVLKRLLNRPLKEED